MDYEKAVLELELDAFDPSKFTLSELVGLEAQVRGEWEGLKRDAAVLNKIYDKLSLEIVPERMEDEGVTNMAIDGVGRVELRADMFVSTQNANALVQWMADNGFEDISTTSVNGSTLKALIKEQMKKKDGLVPPAEIVKVTPYLRAVVVGRSS